MEMGDVALYRKMPGTYIIISNLPLNFGSEFTEFYLFVVGKSGSATWVCLKIAETH
jgi:hypothetical protein